MYYRNVSNEKSDVSSKDDNKSKFDELKKRILEEKETFFYLVIDEGEEKNLLECHLNILMFPIFISAHYAPIPDKVSYKIVMPLSFEKLYQTYFSLWTT